MTATRGGSTEPQSDDPTERPGADLTVVAPADLVDDGSAAAGALPAGLPDVAVVPRWLELLLAVVTLVPAAVVLAGVVLAVRGGYRTSTTLAIGIPAGLVLAVVVGRPVRRRRGSSESPSAEPSEEPSEDSSETTSEQPSETTSAEPSDVPPGESSGGPVADAEREPAADVPPEPATVPTEARAPRAAWTTHLAALVAVLLAVVAGAAIGSAPGEHVIANRDPSVYQTTAVWMSRTGRLFVDTRAGGLEAVDPTHLLTKAGAVYDVGDGRLEFQFAHGASVLLAVAFDLAGPAPMHRLPAAALGVGLLALYVVALRATRRPWLALVAPAVLAVCLPWWFVGRDTYSEPFTIALLWGAVALLGGLAERPRPAAGAALGAVLGAIVAVRADAALYVSVLLFLAGVGSMSSRGPDGAARRWTFVALVGAFSVAVLPGVVDLVDHTGFYVDAVGDEVRLVLSLLLVAGAGGAVLGTVGGLHPRLAAAGRSVGRAVATPAALVVVVVFTLLWWMRPFLSVAIDRSFAYSIVEAIQRRDGLAVNARRLYSEDTVRWLQWYFGAPTVALGIGGLAWSVRSLLRGGAGATRAFVALATAGAGAVYFWNPHITADHPWASRRFAPMVYPGFVVMAVVAVGLLCGPLRRPPVRRRAAAAALAAVMVAVPAVTTWPVRQVAPQRSYLRVLQQACDAMGPDATVVVRGGFEQITLQQAVRAWCDVPAAGTAAGFDGQDLQAIARAARRQGRRAVLFTMDLRTLGGLPEELLGRPRSFGPARDRRAVEPTVDRVPSRYSPPDPDLPANRRNGFTLHVVPVRAD